jgi:Short C-terminal domain
VGETIKKAFGWAIVLASLGAFGLGLYHLIHTGTCASGGPYVSARQCPSDTGLWIGAVTISTFTALAGWGVIAWSSDGGKVVRKDAPGYDGTLFSVPKVTATPSAPAPTPAAARPVVAQGGDPLDQVARLAELHKQGILSDWEFESQKAKILRRS